MELEPIENALKDGKQLLIGINPKDKTLCFAGIYNHTGLIREKYIISNDLYAALILLAAIIVGKMHPSFRRNRKNKRTIKNFHKWIIQNEVFYHVFQNNSLYEGFEAQILLEVPTVENNHLSIRADSIISLIKKTLTIETIT